ncbi:hypothetical protein Q5Y75_11525 [Ruegeria sp. 2205SS24-7]|uniref:hypothetical protein n=1 Tax=Ruegeria discodermiae TaxID=3064389 RepID=UPI0027429C3C|nr:hypothetical protein [Ruegeria sp. 2205SS24-7]MDP5217850.1 hypothetical protein [Ruegeria sp. 2205SS24-7]
MFFLRFAVSATLALCFATPLIADGIMDAEEMLATLPGAVLSGISNEDGSTRWVQTYDH